MDWYWIALIALVFISLYAVIKVRIILNPDLNDKHPRATFTTYSDKHPRRYEEPTE
jgi:hypothetical protein